MRWKPVPLKGFEKTYMVSDTGVIKRVAGGKGGSKSGYILKPSVNNAGYPRINLNAAPYFKRINIHRLVAMAFVPNPNNLPFVDHIDNNRTNNNSDNLQWVTNKQNSQRYFKNHDRRPFTEEHKAKLRAIWAAKRSKAGRVASEEYLLKVREISRRKHKEKLHRKHQSHL